MKLTRCLSLVLLAVTLVTGLAVADTVIKLGVDPGVTEVTVEGIVVRIEASAHVVVYLTVSGETVIGAVEPAPGVRAADVTITVLGPPDRVVFSGRVKAPVRFSDYIPHETGRGEQ